MERGSKEAAAEGMKGLGRAKKWHEAEVTAIRSKMATMKTNEKKKERVR